MRCRWKVVSIKRNVTAWERKQESWINRIYQEEQSSMTIWEGKREIRSNQMKAIAVKRQMLHFQSQPVLSVTNLNLRIDMKCATFWLITIWAFGVVWRHRETAMKSFRCGDGVKRIEAGADGHTISINQKSSSGLPRAHSKWPHCRDFPTWYTEKRRQWGRGKYRNDISIPVPRKKNRHGNVTARVDMPKDRRRGR